MRMTVHSVIIPQILPEPGSIPGTRDAAESNTDKNACLHEAHSPGRKQATIRAIHRIASCLGVITVREEHTGGREMGETKTEMEERQTDGD